MGLRAARLAFLLAMAPAVAFGQPNPPAPDPHVQAPVRRKHSDPEYPKALLESGRDVEVVLTLTIGYPNRPMIVLAERPE